MHKPLSFGEIVSLFSHVDNTDTVTKIYKMVTITNALKIDCLYGPSLHYAFVLILLQLLVKMMVGKL